jgi:hypothetical protein
MLEGKIAQVEGKIAEVEGKIAEVEGKIAELEAELASTGMSKVNISKDPAIVRLGDKEKQLRDEKKQLGDEKKQLRDKENLLLERLARLEGGAKAVRVRRAPGPRPPALLRARLCRRATAHAAVDFASQTLFLPFPRPARPLRPCPTSRAPVLAACLRRRALVPLHALTIPSSGLDIYLRSRATDRLRALSPSRREAWGARGARDVLKSACTMATLTRIPCATSDTMKRH